MSLRSACSVAESACSVAEAADDCRMNIIPGRSLAQPAYSRGLAVLESRLCLGKVIEQFDGGVD
jgi:hypothetical protein